MEGFNTLSPHEQERFKGIVNKLFATCFMAKSLDKDYYFVLTHEALFQQYLEMADWQLNIDQQYDVIYLTSNQNAPRQRFNLRETVLLLLLRLMFTEQAASVARSEKITIAIGDLQARFQALKLSDRNIDKQSLQLALGTFKRYNLIDVIGSDNFASSLIVIHPTILIAIRVNNVKEVYDRIETLNQKGGESDVSFDEVTAD